MQTLIRWASGFVAATGQTPTWLLGPPDGHSYAITDTNTSVTLNDFQPVSYVGVIDMLTTARYGDVVTPDRLVDSDVIAFEHNGIAPGVSGGWESCDWRISDGAATLAFHWDQASVAAVDDPANGSVIRDPHVIANGSITGAVYAGFFEIPEPIVLAENPAAATLEEVVISFLLLRVHPEINPFSANLEITLSVNGGTPDPDAVGVLTHQPDELTYSRFDTCPG